MHDEGVYQRTLSEDFSFFTTFFTFPGFLRFFRLPVWIKKTGTNKKKPELNFLTLFCIFNSFYW